MGDEKSRATFDKLAECFLDFCLALVIERTGRFIEKKDRSVFEKGSCDGNALTLASGEAGAFF